MAKVLEDNWVVLNGEWDLDRKDELIGLFSRLREDGHATIDLRGVTYADSTFLSVLAALALKFNKTPITLLGPQQAILRVLKVVGFDKLFRIVGDE